jgi:small subunit ribosomal protein S18
MARKRDRRKPAPTDRRRQIKKKTSVLTTEHIEWVDYKDVDLLRRFMSERAKIRARRVTGNSAQQQRAVARAIRVAREMALLPYSVRQVTQRSRGSRRDRERPRDEAPMPMPDTAPVADPEAMPTPDGAGIDSPMAGAESAPSPAPAGGEVDEAVEAVEAAGPAAEDGSTE